MARTILNETKTVTVSEELRTWRTEIFSPLGVTPQVVFHREKVTRLGEEINGKVVQSDPIRFDVASNLTREITAAGVTVTVAQMAALVAQLADELDSERGE